MRPCFGIFFQVHTLDEVDSAVAEKSKGSMLHYAQGDESTKEGSAAELAKEFADKIPPLTFSPAEIQGYLLRYRESPQDAVAGTESWIETSLAEKASDHQPDDKDSEVGASESTEDEDEDNEQDKENPIKDPSP